MNKQSSIVDILQSGDEETRRVVLQELNGKSLADTHQLLYLAMADSSWRVRKEAVEVFLAADPSEQYIVELLDKLRDEENAGLRNSAAEAIIRLGERSAKALLDLSGDSDIDVRKFAIDMMGAIGCTVFIPALLHSLADPDENVAAAAAEQLGNIGDNSIIPELLDATISNGSTHFRFCALAALGKLNAHMRVPDQIIALAADDMLRKAVYDCLGSICDCSAADVLINGFELAQRKCRAAAINAWYRIYCRASKHERLFMEQTLAALAGSRVVLNIIDSFDLGDLKIAEAVTALIGIIGDSRGLEILLRAYASEKLSAVAVFALKRLDSSYLDILIEKFALADEADRCAICNIIAELGYTAAGGLICQAVKDNSPCVRRAAVNAVARLGMTDCIEDIVQLLRVDRQNIESSVLSCLQLLAHKAPETVKEVAAGLAVSDMPEIRRDAATLLSAVNGGEILSRLVKDEDAAVRLAAVISIGKLRIASCCNILKAALLDEHPDVRTAAVEALAISGCDDAVNLLVHALKDEDDWVKSAVLKSIAIVDRSLLLDAVKSVFNSSDTYLLITCLELLEGLGTDEALQLVRTAAESRNEDVSGLARSILGHPGCEKVR